MRARIAFWWAVCIAGFLWLALDGALHWDEPAYLYTGGFLGLEDIFRGDFQPSGISRFYLTRPLHILLIYAVVSVTGPGFAAMVSVIAVCTLALLGFLLLSRAVLGVLLPGCKTLNHAMALGLLIPVVGYLAFKTMPESGALLCASAMLLGLLKASRAEGVSTAIGWAVLATACAVLTLWLKGPMLLLPGSCVLAVVIAGGREAHRLRLIGWTLLATLAGFGLAYAGVVAVGIDPSIYTGGVARVGGESEPLSARILNNGTEFGLFFVVLPLAWLSPNRRGFAVMALWFVISTVPLAVLFPSMEARYQSPNVPALIGLTALTIEGLSPRLTAWWAARRGVFLAVAGLVLAFVLASHKVAISVMQHEVMMGQVHAVLHELDERYGEDGYVLLCAWAYSDFHYLRYVYPERAVYSAHTAEDFEVEGLSSELMVASQEKYYAERLVLDAQDLAAHAGRTPVLFGFHYNFAATNLRSFFDHIPGKPLEAELAKMDLSDHLATSWLWDNPAYELRPVVEVGHYRAFEVIPVREAGD